MGKTLADVRSSRLGIVSGGGDDQRLRAPRQAFIACSGRSDGDFPQGAARMRVDNGDEAQ
jgi:hypothetical protein